jgi:hypothetical protein
VPYRHAHYWLLLLFPLTGLAFWPNYFSDPGAAPLAFHVHGATASMWIALLAVQSWSIHQRRNDLHRSLGYGSLILFPLFTVGGILVLQTMAAKFQLGTDPFYEVFGARLAAIDAVATAGIGYLFFMALKTRRKVHLHARYMLTTVFFLFAPILSRIMPALPPFAINGPGDFYRFGYGVHTANLLTIALSFALYLRAPKHGRPFLLIAALIGLTSIAFEFLGRTDIWESLFVASAAVPLPISVTIAFLASAAVSWLGWNAVPARGRTAVSAQR